MDDISTSPKPTAASQIGRWTSSLDLNEVPDDVRRIARRCMIDLVGVCLAGANHDTARMARSMVLAEHGDGLATIIGSPEKTTASGAALVNGAAGHVLDFDDTCYAGITHGTVIIGPAVLAIAEQIGASGEDLMAGFIAGSECAYGLGKATGNSVYFGGWWGTVVYGVIGAAAGAARVLGLDAKQTTNAIAIAALGTGGSIAGLGTDAKPLHCGLAAAAGLRAALLAQAGATGPAAIFEGNRGFAALFNNGVFDTSQLDQLGQVYSLVEPGIFIKPYPSCTANHAAVEAVGMLMSEHNLSFEDIDSVSCFVPELVDISLIYNDPENPQQAQFSMPFTVGCMLANATFGVEHLNMQMLSDPTVRAAMAKVSMHRDDDLTQRAVAGDIGPECARVRMNTTNGDIYESFNSVASGAPTKPMSDDALDDKFRILANHAGLGGSADPLLARLHILDTLENLHDLWP
jgi:2-methylcitrate dehydratase PrpD